MVSKHLNKYALGYKLKKIGKTYIFCNIYCLSCV